MTFLIAFTLNLQVLSVCLILDSHDSIFQLLEIKVSNLWEMRHISIWTYTVSNNNLSEHHERIFESDIFWSWILTDSFPPFHPSLTFSITGFKFYMNQTFFFPLFFPSKYGISYILLPLFYLFILSMDLFYFLLPENFHCCSTTVRLSWFFSSSLFLFNYWGNPKPST